MSEYKIADNIIITDTEKCGYHLQKEVSFTIDIIEILSQIDSNDMYYIDNKFHYSTDEIPYARYLWLNTGLITALNKPLFISLFKGTSDKYEGYFVGTPKIIVEKIVNYYPNNAKQIYNNYSMFCNEIVAGSSLDTPSQDVGVTSFDKVSEIAQCVYSQLVYNSWESISGLDRFIKIIGERLKTLTCENRTEYYIMNNIKSVIVNTGLIGKFNEDILMMYRFNQTKGNYDAYKQISTKKQMLDEGFSKEQVDVINLSPIRFFDGDGLLRNVSISDFDINPQNLEHIISERRDRFPKDIANCSSDVLAIKIYDSLNTGLKMLERDFTYAKPTYSAKLNAISWFLPLHIFTSFSEEPELVMVIKKDVEDLYYEVKTILPYDSEVKDRMTAVALYRKYW